MTRSTRRPGLLWLSLGLALSATAACRGPESRREERVLSAVRHGDYARAVEEAQRLVDEEPGDARFQQLQRDAQVAYVLDQGRDAVFHGELEEALELFEQGLELAPGNEVVDSWIKKTRAQLAVYWLDRAAERTGPEHLGEAEEAYEKVLQYDPENFPARRGLAHVLLLTNYRAGMSKTYFDDGLSSFRLLMLDQAERGFKVSQRYRENEPAALRSEQVQKMMAEERLAQAKSLEATGMFFAARNEYRLVLLIEPGSVEGRAGLDRMDREARATHSLAKTDMAMRRGELESAQKTLAEAQILTTAQADQVSLMQSGIEEKRLETIYLDARSLAEDYRYPEAVETFDRLLALAPDYRDARLRKATLEEFIRLTEEFYDKALIATDDAVAEEYLRAIHPIIWPEYKDVVQRLEEIEKRKAAKKAAEGADGDGTATTGGG